MKYPSIKLSMLQRQLISLAFAFLLFTLPSFAAETRGVKRVEIKTSAGKAVGLYEESHALVIGVSDYTAGWPKHVESPGHITLCCTLYYCLEVRRNSLSRNPSPFGL